MLTNVQVLPGSTSVARFDDVVVWFETGPQGGGVMLTQLLQAVQGVSSGSVPSRQLGARLAAVLNTGDAKAVPALVAATPEGEGLRVVVHGWGAVVADGIHLPNGWVDQVITDCRTFFLGRNTVTPVAPVEGGALDLEDGVVPGDGVSFALSTAGPQPASEPAPEQAAPEQAAPASVPQGIEPPAYEPPPSDPPPPPADPVPSVAAGAAAPTTAWPPPGAQPAPPAPASASAPVPAPTPAAAPDPPPAPQWSTPAPVPAPAPPPAPQWSAPAPVPPAPPGRLVLDDGSSAVLEYTSVLGSAPHGSPAVQTGMAIPLTVVGLGVAPVHVEIRVEQDRVAVRDLGAGTTYVLPPGTPGWMPLAPGQVTPLSPGTRVALGQRTFSYERP